MLVLEIGSLTVISLPKRWAKNNIPTYLSLVVLISNIIILNTTPTTITILLPLLLLLLYYIYPNKRKRFAFVTFDCSVSTRFCDLLIAAVTLSNYVLLMAVYIDFLFRTTKLLLLLSALYYVSHCDVMHCHTHFPFSSNIQRLTLFSLISLLSFPLGEAHRYGFNLFFQTHIISNHLH